MASSKEATAQNGETVAGKVKLEGEALKDAIKKQVEYYFSRENLCQDAFLVGKMDAQHFVDVAIIADFKMVKLLTTDTDLILSCVAGSDKVIVDAANKKMKPVAVNARTTLILRNIPSDAAETEVRALITGDKWPKIVSLRSDVGDNWFVSFETEEHTKTALAMAKDKKFKDKSISCAIKSENLLKGLQPGAQSPPKGGPINGTYPGMYGGYVAANGGYGWNGGYAPDGGFGRGARAGGTRGGRAGPGVAAPPANGVAVAEDGTARNGNKRSKAKPREGRDASGTSPNTEKKVEQAPINLNDFPSLAGSAPPPTGYSKPKNGVDMISIFKEAKGGEAEGGKRDTSEDASQNKAHDSNNGNSEVSNKATANGDKVPVLSAKDAVASTGSSGEGAEKTIAAAPAINGTSAAPANAGTKKMSWAQMATATKPAPDAVST